MVRTVRIRRLPLLPYAQVRDRLIRPYHGKSCHQQPAHFPASTNFRVDGVQTSLYETRKHPMSNHLRKVWIISIVSELQAHSHFTIIGQCPIQGSKSPYPSHPKWVASQLFGPAVDVQTKGRPYSGGWHVAQTAFFVPILLRTFMYTYTYISYRSTNVSPRRKW